MRTAPGAFAAALLLGLFLSPTLAGDTPGGASPSAQVVRVPRDAPTIRAALERVQPGGMVLVGPGTYHEQVIVATPDVTLRGTDRNAVVIDGRHKHDNGILVVADGARIQNLTVRNEAVNGVLVSGAHTARGTIRDPARGVHYLQRYEVDHVTATGNGLYGIYAFNARDGAIRASYASGSPDSGIYVGQCRRCDAVVEGNVAEHNAVGYENANASEVLVVGNRFAGNRVGMTVLSSAQELFSPERRSEIVGNLVGANADAGSPASAEGGFGVGLALAGAQENAVTRNRIVANPSAGVVLTSEDKVPSRDNQLTENVFAANGVDVVDIATGAAPAPVDVPAGVDPSAVTPAPPLPGIAGRLTLVPKRLATRPRRPDVTTAPVPDDALLAEQSTVRW